MGLSLDRGCLFRRRPHTFTESRENREGARVSRQNVVVYRAGCYLNVFCYATSKGRGKRHRQCHCGQCLVTSRDSCGSKAPMHRAASATYTACISTPSLGAHVICASLQCQSIVVKSLIAISRQPLRFKSVLGRGSGHSNTSRWPLIWMYFISTAMVTDTWHWQTTDAVRDKQFRMLQFSSNDAKKRGRKLFVRTTTS